MFLRRLFPALNLTISEYLAEREAADDHELLAVLFDDVPTDEDLAKILRDMKDDDSALKVCSALTLSVYPVSALPCLGLTLCLPCLGLTLCLNYLSLNLSVYPVSALPSQLTLS